MYCGYRAPKNIILANRTFIVNSWESLDSTSQICNISGNEFENIFL